MSASDQGRDATIVTLTDSGAALARKLKAALPDAEHLHRPEPFIAVAQRAFTEGRRCIFVCASGIVVRALAPVLRDKHRDPAALVLDENGRFVIPLLSAHEGGGAAFGRLVADAISAQCVVTSATDYSRPVYALGVGCVRGCPVAELRELADDALARLDPGVPLAALASIDIKSDEPGLIALGRMLSVPLKFYSASQLREVEDQLSERSDAVFREVGCYGVAEAAALRAASELTGRRAERVLDKLKTARATVAAARSYPEEAAP